MFAVAVAALGFSSCSETWDDNPVIKTHEGVQQADFLNEPVMKDQVIMLTDQNREGVFHMTCSQPDFGYAAVGTYKVQISRTEDFKTYEEVSQDFYDCGAINVLNGDVASILEKLSGVKTEDDLPLPYQPVYMRLRAYVAQDEAQTTFISNVVKFKGVSADYLAIWVSDVPIDMYLRGAFPETGGWEAIEKYQFVTGPTDNTWVTQTIDIANGTQFKVADSSWGACNWGAGNPTITPDTNYVLNTDPANGGPGNITMSGNFHGYAMVTLSKGTYTLILVPTE